MIHRGVFGYVISFFVCSLLGATNLYSNEHSTLTFQQRVTYQRAIERVYWNHRIWPKENISVKPSLDSVMPSTILQAKVGDYLLKSNALAVFWNKSITPKQLQAELDRMAKESKRPQVLRELFQACDNDPYIIAECLVRPILADRLLRNFYDYDKGLHSSTRSKAMIDSSSQQLKLMTGIYSETLLIRDTGMKRTEHENAIYLDTQGWKEWSEQLDLNHLPLKKIAPLKEEANDFYVTSVLKKNKNRIVFATVRWPKKSFQEWWNENRQSLSISIDASSYPYVLNAISGGCVNDTWNSSQFPAERMHHTSVWTGSEMIIWGGGFNTFFGDGSRYDPSTDTWSLTSTNNAPVGRTYHTAVWTGTEMIIWGGGNFSSVFNSGGRYNPITDTWNSTSLTNAPVARWEHTAVWTGNEMLIWGGDKFSDYFNDGGRYNPVTDTWMPISLTNAPAARRNHSAIWAATEMIIWGGQGKTGVVDTGGRYDPIADAWISTSTMSAPIERMYHKAVWTGTEMIVWGGYGNSGEMDTGGRYDPLLDSWQATTITNAPVARTAHTAVWTGSEMIIWGGFTSSLETNTGTKYSPGTDSWVATTMTNAPKYRASHSAIWTGDEMIVWGGTDGQNRLNSGGRYDPVADNWIPTAQLNIPGGRVWHTSVWTGNEMIIWGGFDHSEYLSDGAAYNPAVDSWTTLSTMNAPSKRREHIAVWTGTEMIVWGGYDGFFINSGGKYNPISDSWSTVSMTNAPAGRIQDTAIWTGTELIIWGGFPYSGSTGDGARYNPSTDNWLTISSNNAPSYRSGHSAIWTGQQMIVWGGAGCVDPPLCSMQDVLNNGGSYDPAADVWFGISSSNAPSARSVHTAVWSGNEMIVWGGSNDFALSDGARYNPSVDSWSAVSNTNSPSARALHTSVWTGQSMITWGGAGSTGVLLGDGADYDVSSDSWTPISSSGAPLARDYHTAVWTGDSMIVWGGVVAINDTTNTYGSYCRNNNCPFISLDDTLPDGTVGAPYNGQIIVTGGTPPYAFSVSSGSLPAGLTLDSVTGVISGTPTSAENADFGIIVTDSLGCTGTRTYSITISGSCLFCDDFEDGVLDPNWSYLKPTWNEAAGLLSGTPVKKKAIVVASPIFAGCQTCYEEVAMKTAGGLSNKVWLYGWYVDKKNTMELLVKEENDKIVLKQRVNGMIVAKNKANITIDPQTIYILRLTFDGTQFSVSVNGTPLFTLTPVGAVPMGTIGFAVKNTTASFDSVTVN